MIYQVSFRQGRSAEITLTIGGSNELMSFINTLLFNKITEFKVRVQLDDSERLGKIEEQVPTGTFVDPDALKRDLGLTNG